jgi:hypothetical protein
MLVPRAEETYYEPALFRPIAQPVGKGGGVSGAFRLLLAGWSSPPEPFRRKPRTAREGSLLRGEQRKRKAPPQRG